jgi:uncharacterized membrane protein
MIDNSGKQPDLKHKIVYAGTGIGAALGMLFGMLFFENQAFGTGIGAIVGLIVGTVINAQSPRRSS